jgi:uncharacterized protein DUF402
MWTYGDQIALRYRWGNDLAWVHPVTVVEDSPQCIALYEAMDTPIKMPLGDPGNPLPRALSFEKRHSLPWRLGDSVWQDHSVLWLARPGAHHAIALFWRGAEREFLGWYGNLQTPLVRSSAGFDSADHVLDVVIHPNRTWDWKDEDEFAEARHLGRFTPAEAQRVRAEGERVIAAMEAGAWPFDAGWEDWQPDPAWSIPRVRDGWDRD